MYPVSKDTEHTRHLLVFDRPHIYKCSCGLVRMIFISEAKVEEKTLEHPPHVALLGCGHAICALRDGKCVLCGE